ncbi:MAG: thrombospondin type 3 repeat-containing protein, partial [Planctomycetota bacterium]
LIPRAHGSALASPFSLDRVIDTATAVPGIPGETFSRIDEPPLISNGRVILAMRYGIDDAIEGLYTVDAGSPPVEIAVQGGAMPDGAGTIQRFTSVGFDISGDNLVYTVRRDTTDEDVIFLRRGDVDELVLELEVTPLPDSPGDTFNGLGSSDTYGLDGDNFVFEGFGSAGQNGIYYYTDGALTTLVQKGDISPDGSTFTGSFDEPSLDGENVAFEARTSDDAVQGVFAMYDGALRTAATSAMTAPGGAASFNFSDNPQIDGSFVVFGASLSDGSRGIFRSDLSTTPATVEAIVRVGDPVPGFPNEQFTGFGDEAVSMDGRLIAFGAEFSNTAGVGTGDENRSMFAWIDGSLTAIATSVDSLDGQSPESFDFHGEGIDGPQISFDVTFSDGANAAYVATLLPDSDADGIVDESDNCTLISNPDQRDSNGDGFGNACDADLNNDGVVNVLDLGELRLVFFGDDADADFNGDGVVNIIDLGVLRAGFFLPPGPSGLVD